ncbi:hypothetical protein HRR83_008345 [Exophiala dermatitidis]|uniref:Amidohydrolase-related domain-containing protein n=2 Tax=Exophiala dermatitidis TaxID=5970 RepID=H6C595_EXODN|nr:uncharacterized protein HMPREF1120_07789 [Exophiala dermatitidis NIH/UT8656]KAJ4505443.1 hypothetical protein HRR75_007312 [Exophiala dermatitidis]EHY59807.1 hypothetical protein HMPREF1120_07789 [Exophiala dermatitidis NIH/UT8656]KAJ4507043.1 hypothetical protein HRR73_007864 [Exophiala dermatitidis]KAJ4507639.1 hypothetical protein HRR74_007966 [Exophiala dermatitidis]KAJ4533059.1 hypothetical protein HRR76_008029 [Exophiala dermatitidis]
MSPTVIHSTRLFDGYTTHDNATVVLDQNTGTITSVSTDSTQNHFPSGATVIDGSGHTLLPGLIEAHCHVYNLHLPPGADESDILQSPLRCGITTVCDMHSDLGSVNNWRKKIAEELEKAKSGGGTVALSDLKTSLLGATIEGGWPKPIVLAHDPSEELRASVARWPNVTVENAPGFVEEHKTNGADYIKLMQENCCSLALPTGSVPVATLELQTAVVKAAHAAGLPVVGHALSVDMTEIVLKSGADGLTHTFVDQPPPQNIIDLYKQTGAFVIPTLTVLASLTGELQDVREKFAEIARRKKVVNDFTLQNMVKFEGMKDPSAKFDYAVQSVKQLRRAGIDVVAGTDAVAGLRGTAIGPSLWMELELYTERCGMSVPEALRSATAVTAKRFGFHDRGVVAEGKRADLVLVKGNVTERLQDLWEGEGIVGVWKQGFKAA